MRKKQFKPGNRQKNSVEKYLEEIVIFTPLPPAEEIELTRSARKGESFALDKLVKANLRFVISVAKQYQYNGLSFEDLICEGNSGLIEAAKRFDETRGFKFISYAVWWIRQSILKAIAEQTRMVRLPVNHVNTINKVNKVVDKLCSQYGEKPSIRDVADYLDMTESEVSDILKIMPRHLSLNAPNIEEDGRSLLDVVENRRVASPDDSLMQESLKDEISIILDTLKHREAEIILLYFGLVGERSLNLDEIGDHLKLSRERIRQIKKDALRRLRRNTKSELLKKYLG
ncbi:RNA polymerase sigma factor RpoD/SigA [candidate division KSB1 bacterium]|nr:RNA polymerase sigma factor RpoD/SigA [candidate division KSB1 bacterium]